jgi:hypothetical protein
MSVIDTLAVIYKNPLPEAESKWQSSSIIRKFRSHLAHL